MSDREDPRDERAPKQAPPAEEPTDAAGDETLEPESAPKPPDIEARLAAAEAERDSYLELARRTQADFDNYKKRAAREAAQVQARARSELVSALLPVVDNLERALCVEADSETALAQGVELVYRELLAVLDRSGVERFGSGGEAFDPNFHEALSAKSAEGVESGLVLEVAQTGYTLDGAVIRPARVVVSE